MNIDFKKTFDDCDGKFTKAYIARFFGVSRQAVRNWYNGQRIPMAKNTALVRFFKENNCTVSYK